MQVKPSLNGKTCGRKVMFQSFVITLREGVEAALKAAFIRYGEQRRVEAAAEDRLVDEQARARRQTAAQQHPHHRAEPDQLVAVERDQGNQEDQDRQESNREAQ